MLNKDTIAIQLVREALLQSCASPLVMQDVLRTVGVDPALLEDAEGRVPAHTYARMWRLLAQRLDDEFFGMDPRKLRAGSLAFMCRAAMAQPTLVQGLELVLGFLSLMLERLPATLVRRQSLAEIVLHEPDDNPARAFTYFTYWMIVHGVACWLVGRRIPILAIELRCAPPEHGDDYAVMFSENLRFGRPRTRMIFAADCLDAPIKRTEGELQRFWRRHRPIFWSSTATRKAWPVRSSTVCDNCLLRSGLRPKAWRTRCACQPRRYAAVWPKKGRRIRGSRMGYARSWPSAGWPSLN